jgi:3-oxoacyl-[acyl-carrier-protein] synthase-3
VGVVIKQIEYYLPENVVTNLDIQSKHPEWNIDKVSEKSGVYQRHIAGPTETALDLALKAAEKLFSDGSISLSEIDGIMFCTQSPDFIMPSNAFLVHKHFGFSTKVWAFDYNLACSGFVYGLSIARGMLETNMANNILLITADTYSKYINDGDRSTSVLFGDAAAVCVIGKEDGFGIIDIQLASSGKEYESFYIPSGGLRSPAGEMSKISSLDSSGNTRTPEHIHMNGFAVWKFISQAVPDQINDLLTRNNLTVKEIDFYGFHQASKLTLDSLIKAAKIDSQKVFMNLGKIGNTVSASIPIILKDGQIEGKLKKGDLVLLSGFGVGLSWGSLVMKY